LRLAAVRTQERHYTVGEQESRGGGVALDVLRREARPAHGIVGVAKGGPAEVGGLLLDTLNREAEHGVLLLLLLFSEERCQLVQILHRTARDNEGE
jgi:hypothetical protein